MARTTPIWRMAWLARAMLSLASTAHAQLIQANTTTPSKIMPMGDSITDGAHDASGYGGYRYDLEQDLLSGGYNFQFVGSQTDGSSSLRAIDQHHEGYSGYTVEPFGGRTSLYNSANLSGSPISHITTYNPDVLLPLIGTNNIDLQQPPADALSQYSGLLTEAFALKPGITVVVGGIPHNNFHSGDASYDANVGIFNTQLQTLVNTFKAKGDNIVFTNATETPIAELADGWHPNPTGYTDMAAGWYGTLTAAPEPSPKVGLLIGVAAVVGLCAFSAKRRAWL